MASNIETAINEIKRNLYRYVSGFEFTPTSCNSLATGPQPTSFDDDLAR